MKLMDASYKPYTYCLKAALYNSFSVPSFDYDLSCKISSEFSVLHLTTICPVRSEVKLSTCDSANFISWCIFDFSDSKCV